MPQNKKHYILKILFSSRWVCNFVVEFDLIWKRISVSGLKNYWGNYLKYLILMTNFLMFNFLQLKMSSLSNSTSRSGGLSGSIKVDDFIKLEKIGEGTYGIVFKGKNKKTGEIVRYQTILVKYWCIGFLIYIYLTG